MVSHYSQFRASLAIAKASLLSMVRSPTSVVFSILFPIIFIVVFGTMVDTTQVIIKVGLDPKCDTNSLLYKGLLQVKMLKLIPYQSESQLIKDLEKGRLTAILDIRADSKILFVPHYQVKLLTTGASSTKAPLLETIINDLISRMDKKLFAKNNSIAHFTSEKMAGRIYRSIDFILPGQLGFSLLMAGVFGSAFLFFNLRQSLVLKRVFASPIKRSYLILGEMLSRLFFQVIGFMIMVSLGYFFFNFTLVNGFLTFAEMLLFSLFGLIVFMGIGFIISGFLQNESSIAPVANTITLPQILLCGLFFPVENYPSWLQAFCKLLPLTFFVDGLRNIAFEGLHIWQIPIQLAGMVCWTIIISFITVKVFRWE